MTDNEKLASLDDIRDVIAEMNHDKDPEPHPGLVARILNKPQAPVLSPEEKKRKADLEKRTANLNRKVNAGRLGKWFPKKVRIAWFERNGEALCIKDMAWEDGIVSDRVWGRAAEIGADCPPIEIAIDKDSRLGFAVNGDKGVGLSKLELGENALKLETTSQLVWAATSAKRMAETYAADVTLRTKIVWLLGGAVAGLIVGAGL